jgi:Transposase, Mutator family
MRQLSLGSSSDEDAAPGRPRARLNRAPKGKLLSSHAAGQARTRRGRTSRISHQREPGQQRKERTPPGSDHPDIEAKKALQDIYNAEDRDHAEQAIRVFTRLYQAKFPKAVANVADDQYELLEFYDYPAEHWIHLRTTNPIESTFATVRLRTKVTRGAGSRAAALAMVFKLVESAQARWRIVNGAHLVALVRAGARFERGVLVERPEARTA